MKKRHKERMVAWALIEEFCGKGSNVNNQHTKSVATMVTWRPGKDRESEFVQCRQLTKHKLESVVNGAKANNFTGILQKYVSSSSSERSLQDEVRQREPSLVEPWNLAISPMEPFPGAMERSIARGTLESCCLTYLGSQEQWSHCHWKPWPLDSGDHLVVSLHSSPSRGWMDSADYSVLNRFSNLHRMFCLPPGRWKCIHRDTRRWTVGLLTTSLHLLTSVVSRQVGEEEVLQCAWTPHSCSIETIPQSMLECFTETHKGARILPNKKTLRARMQVVFHHYVPGALSTFGDYLTSTQLMSRPILTEHVATAPQVRFLSASMFGRRRCCPRRFSLGV